MKFFWRSNHLQVEMAWTDWHYSTPTFPLFISCTLIFMHDAIHSSSPPALSNLCQRRRGGTLFTTTSLPPRNHHPVVVQVNSFPSDWSQARSWKPEDILVWPNLLPWVLVCSGYCQWFHTQKKTTAKKNNHSWMEGEVIPCITIMRWFHVWWW